MKRWWWVALSVVTGVGQPGCLSGADWWCLGVRDAAHSGANAQAKPVEMRQAPWVVNVGNLEKGENCKQRESPAEQRAGLAARATEIKEFVDSFMAEAMSRLNLPGAAVTVVADGKVLLAQGYGWSNVDRRVPVSVGETVWPVASVTKLFTATAAMRLVEEGKLELDRDYREAVPELADFGRGPVTLRALLTHTSGLEEDSFGMVRPGIASLEPLAEYLRHCRLRQRRCPGERISYCNHGLVLVGRLIELVTGMRYEEYVQQTILEPLGMRRSGFAWDEAKLAGLAAGYVSTGRGWRAVSTDTILATPSGGLHATVEDMAKFLLLHTGDGSVDGRRNLRPETLALMHRPHFRVAPQAAGMALGFWERRQNGLEGLEHGGAIRGYACLLAAWPSQRVGIFVVTNCQEVALGESFITSFLDRFYPLRAASPEAERDEANRAVVGARPERMSAAGQGPADIGVSESVNSTPSDTVPLDRLTGFYYLERYRPESLEKLRGLFAELQVRVCNEEELEIHFPLQTLPAWRVRRESATVFREVRGHRPVVFLLDEKGRAAHVALNAILCGERAGWYDRSSTHLAVAGGLVLWWLVGLLRVGYWQTALCSATGAASVFAGGRYYQVMYSGLGLAWMLGLCSVLIGVDSWRFTYGVPWWLRGLLVLPLLAMTALVLSAVRGDRSLPFTRRSRFWFAVGDGLSAGVWLAEIAYWHLWPWG